MVFKISGTATVDNNRNLSASSLGAIGSNSYIEVLSIPTAIGSTRGYTSGGLSNPTTASNVTDSFPFAADSNATDVGDLSQSRYYIAAQSSTTHGYTSGGATPPSTNTIDRFPFAASANSSDVGDLTQARYYVAGQVSSTHGYSSGGFGPPTVNTIDRFPFAVNANAEDVGDLTLIRRETAGQSSPSHGYNSGGSSFSPGPTVSYNVIDRFPFASNANATDVGDLPANHIGSAGQSSTVSGYTSGGLFSAVIARFSFAVNVNSNFVGNLTQERGFVAGQSGTASGYTSGGGFPVGGDSTTYVNVVDKFPFSTDTNASDVGDLTVARLGVAGQQY